MISQKTDSFQIIIKIQIILYIIIYNKSLLKKKQDQVYPTK